MKNSKDNANKKSVGVKISQEKLEQLKNNEIKIENNTNVVNENQNANQATQASVKADETTSNSQVNTEAEAKPKPLTKKQEWINLIKFVLFSISAGVIQILAFTLLSELVFHDAENEYGLSYFIALALSVIWNFTFNRKFTFKSAKNVPIAMLLVLIYYCAFTPLSIWWGIALTDIACWNSYLVLAITMVINFLTEYLWTRFVVYRNNINTAPQKEKKDKTDADKQKREKVKKEKVKKIQQKRYTAKNAKDGEKEINKDQQNGNDEQEDQNKQQD